MSQVQNRRGARFSFKRVMYGGLGSGIGILGLLLAVAVYIVEKLTHPRRADTLADLYTFSPFELNLPAEEITFPPLHGEHHVSGWYVPHPQATSTVLICPGYRGRRSDVLGMCGQLWRAGYNVLAFEYYGHGTFVGKRITLGYREINDFLGALAYAKQRAPHARIGALGYSMGASIAIMAAARNEEVEALVADSAFASHTSVIAFAVRRTAHLPFALFSWLTDNILWIRAGYRFNQVEPLREIARIAPRPILIIHSLKDTLVDPRDASQLFESAGEPKELWLVPDAEHCGAYFNDRAAYSARVVAFFDKYLKSAYVQEDLSEAS